MQSRNNGQSFPGGPGGRIPADINRMGTTPCTDQLRSGTWDWCLETTQLRAPRPIPMGDRLCGTCVVPMSNRPVSNPSSFSGEEGRGSILHHSLTG